MKLPAQWSKVPLHQVAHVQTGLSKSQNRNGPSVLRPYLRVANVQDGYLDLAAIKQIDVPASQVERFSLRNGDVLLTEGGDFDKLGRGSIWNGEIPDCVHQNHVFAVRVIDRAVLLPEFLACEIQSSRAKNYFLSCAKQTTNLASINSTQIKKLPVLVPPLVEQRAIINAIAIWDTAIQKTEQLIAAKERRYCALSGQLLFGLTRFKRYGTSDPKSLHWFSVSSRWSIVEIGEIAREISAVNDTANDLPVLSCTKYDGLVDSLQYFNKQVFSHDTSKYKLVRRGQFAYATNHIEEGSIGYQDFVAAGLVSPIYTVFQADASRVDDGYLYKLLKTEKLRQLFAASTNASVDRRGSLRWKEFARIHIPLPSLEEQRRISTLLDTANQEIALLREEVAALKTQKRGLMQKLLTGEWRLKIDHSEASTQAKEAVHG